MKHIWPFAFGRRRDELQQEIESHLQMALADRVARGESEGIARREALREFGNVPLIQDITRNTWGWLWIEQLVQDFRYALRQMRRSPMFTATVIGTLGLGIAATAAMFTVVDHVLLNPVSYKNPDRIISITETANEQESGRSLVPWLDIRQWTSRDHAFQQIAFWGRMSGRNYLEEKTSAVQVDSIRVSPNLFPTLGVNPSMGRGFLPLSPGFAADANSGTIVLSYPLWQAEFGGERDVLGRSVTIDTTSYTVIGVMPRGFAFPRGDAEAAQVWIPVQLGKEDQTRMLAAMKYEAIARLRTGQTPASARTEMQAIQAAIAPEYTNARTRSEHSSIALERYSDSITSPGLRRALLALLGASAVLWLIASFNATNLFLARSAMRQRELALRRALGASRSRVARQMIAESIAFSAAAAGVGIVAAIVSLRLLALSLQAHLPIPIPAKPDNLILLVLIGLTLLSALGCGAWPILQVIRTPIEPVLKQGGFQAGTGRGQHRARSMLVALEMAFSLTLLVACGLLMRTIYSLRHAPLGFRIDHIIVANLDIPSFRFADRNMTQVLYEPLLVRARQLHGVQAAGLMSEVPLGKTFAAEITLRMNGKSTPAYLKAVSPEMREVFGFKMAAGRFFNAQDTANSQPAIVVNEAFARLFSPDTHNPEAIVGRKLFSASRDSKSSDSAVVIGVMKDERQHEVAEPARPEIDICIPQITPSSMFYQSTEGIAMDLAVRTDQPAAEMIPELRDALRQSSPELANATITTMDQIVQDSYGNQRFTAHLLEIFGGSALFLSVAGLYGLLSYIVAQRRREIGVRIALGAARRDLLWLILLQAGRMLAVGMAVGLGLAFLSSRLVSNYLYGITVHDLWTYTGSAVLLFVAGMLAAYVPALRATRVNPMESLRAE